MEDIKISAFTKNEHIDTVVGGTVDTLLTISHTPKLSGESQHFGIVLVIDTPQSMNEAKMELMKSFVYTLVASLDDSFELALVLSGRAQPLAQSMRHLSGSYVDMICGIVASLSVVPGRGNQLGAILCARNQLSEFTQNGTNRGEIWMVTDDQIFSAVDAGAARWDCQSLRIFVIGSSNGLSDSLSRSASPVPVIPRTSAEISPKMAEFDAVATPGGPSGLVALTNSANTVMSVSSDDLRASVGCGGISDATAVNRSSDVPRVIREAKMVLMRAAYLRCRLIIECHHSVVLREISTVHEVVSRPNGTYVVNIGDISSVGDINIFVAACIPPSGKSPTYDYSNRTILRTKFISEYPPISLRYTASINKDDSAQCCYAMHAFMCERATAKAMVSVRIIDSLVAAGTVDSMRRADILAAQLATKLSGKYQGLSPYFAEIVRTYRSGARMMDPVPAEFAVPFVHTITPKGLMRL